MFAIEGFHWDPSISLGSLLSIISVIIAVLKANSNFAKLELKVETMWHKFLKGHNNEEA